MKIKKAAIAEVWTLRHKVMWPNKDIEYIKLENDHEGLHYGLFIGDKLVSVISLFIKSGHAQFRKFATLKEEQGKGYGTKLLNHVIEESKKLKLETIWCNARKEKIDFYKKFGLNETDKSFKRGKQEYIIMQMKNLR